MGLIDIEEKVAVIFIGTFFQQLILIADVSRSVSQYLLDVSYTLGATRSLMQELLIDIWQASHKTVLFITHDIDESMRSVATERPAAAT